MIFIIFFTFLGAEANHSFFVVKSNYQKLVPHQEMTSGGKLSNEGKDPTYCRQNIPTFSVQRKSKMLCFRHTVGKIKVKIRKRKFTLCNICMYIYKINSLNKPKPFTFHLNNLKKLCCNANLKKNCP